MDNYIFAENIQLIQYLWIWIDFFIMIGITFGIILTVWLREPRVKRTEIEKTIHSVGKYLGKLQVRAKQKDAMILSKILEKGGISEDDKYLLKVIENYIYFER